MNKRLIVVLGVILGGIIAYANGSGNFTNGCLSASPTPSVQMAKMTVPCWFGSETEYLNQSEFSNNCWMTIEILDNGLVWFSWKNGSYGKGLGYLKDLQKMVVEHGDTGLLHYELIEDEQPNGHSIVAFEESIYTYLMTFTDFSKDYPLGRDDSDFFTLLSSDDARKVLSFLNRYVQRGDDFEL